MSVDIKSELKIEIRHNTDQSQSSESSINLHFASFSCSYSLDGRWNLSFVNIPVVNSYFLELQTNEMLVNNRWLC